MAFKTLQNTTVQATVQATDILAIARGTGALSNVVVSALVTFLQGASGLGTFFLQAANNLSDLASAATARTNLGLGSIATHPTSDFATAASPVITGGITLTGSTKQNVSALGTGNTIDTSVSDFFTASITANTTYSFTNAVASEAEAFVLRLTLGSGAVPTWPATVKWPSGSAPVLGNGTHVLGFITFDGGTTWEGFVGAINVS